MNTPEEPSKGTGHGDIAKETGDSHPITHHTAQQVHNNNNSSGETLLSASALLDHKATLGTSTVVHECEFPSVNTRSASNNDDTHNVHISASTTTLHANTKGFSMESFIQFLRYIAQHDISVEKMIREFLRFLDYVALRVEYLAGGCLGSILPAAIQRPITALTRSDEWKRFESEIVTYLYLLLVKTDLCNVLHARLRVLFYLLQKHESVQRLFANNIPAELLRSLKLQKFLRSEDASLRTLASEFVYFVSSLTNDQGEHPYANVETYIVANQTFTKRHTAQAREQYRRFCTQVEKQQQFPSSASNASLVVDGTICTHHGSVGVAFQFYQAQSFLAQPFATFYGKVNILDAAPIMQDKTHRAVRETDLTIKIDDPMVADSTEDSISSKRRHHIDEDDTIKNNGDTLSTRIGGGDDDDHAIVKQDSVVWMAPRVINPVSSDQSADNARPVQPQSINKTLQTFVHAKDRGAVDSRDALLAFAQKVHHDSDESDGTTTTTTAANNSLSHPSATTLPIPLDHHDAASDCSSVNTTDTSSTVIVDSKSRKKEKKRQGNMKIVELGFDLENIGWSFKKLLSKNVISKKQQHREADKKKPLPRDVKKKKHLVTASKYAASADKNDKNNNGDKKEKRENQSNRQDATSMQSPSNVRRDGDNTDTRASVDHTIAVTTTTIFKHEEEKNNTEKDGSRNPVVTATGTTKTVEESRETAKINDVGSTGSDNDTSELDTKAPPTTHLPTTAPHVTSNHTDKSSSHENNLSSISTNPNNCFTPSLISSSLSDIRFIDSVTMRLNLYNATLSTNAPSTGGTTNITTSDTTQASLNASTTTTVTDNLAMRSSSSNNNNDSTTTTDRGGNGNNKQDYSSSSTTTLSRCQIILALIPHLRSRLAELSRQLNEHCTTLARVKHQKLMDLQAFSRRLIDSKQQCIQELSRSSSENILTVTKMLTCGDRCTANRYAQEVEVASRRFSEKLEAAMHAKCDDEEEDAHTINLVLKREKTKEYDDAAYQYDEFMELQVQLNSIQIEESLNRLESALREHFREIKETCTSRYVTVPQPPCIDPATMKSLESNLAKTLQMLQGIDCTSLQSKQALIGILQSIAGMNKMIEKVGEQNQILAK